MMWRSPTSTSTQNKPPRLEEGEAATKDRLQKKNKKEETDGKIGSKFSHVETPLFAHLEQPSLRETSLSR